MVTTQQYMALSAVSYTDMPEGNNPTTNLPWTISELIAADLVQGYKDGNGNVKPEFSGLASLGSYTLVNSQPNTSSGFAAVAFQSPSGEIVFAFRGTEPNVYSPTNPTGIADDLITDAQIALGGSTIGQPNQFKDAETFFNSTLTIAGSNSGYSFTGHSMGGGIAQYMTYITGEAGHSTTFNAVGIGQVPALTTVNPSDYNDSITDYVNENDIIGNYGTQLGTTIYIQDQSGANINQATIDDILSYYASHKAMTYGTILGNNVNASAQIYSIHKDKIDELVRESFKAHNLSSFFSGTNPSNYSFANNASDSNLQELTDLLVQVGTSTEVEGTAAVVFTLSTGKQLIVSYAEGVLNVFVTFGEIVASIVYTIGDGIAEVLYNTGVAIGELTENAENGFNTFLQLFNGSEYVVINGTDENDTLSGPSIKANAIYAQMGDDTVTGTSYGDVLDGGAGNDTIYGNYGADLIYGREGDDIIEGGNSSDILFGGAGNDTLYGGDYRNWESFLTPERASDTLDGGAGNDMLQGGGGDDTYIFGRGYGHDVIFDAAYDVAGYSDTGFDTLRFTGNVAPSDIAVSRHYSDLIFTIIDTGETVTVSSFFGSNGRNAIEKVTFPDGTIWDYSTLLNKAQYIQGTEAGETIDAFYDQVNFVHAGGGVIPLKKLKQRGFTAPQGLANSLDANPVLIEYIEDFIV